MEAFITGSHAYGTPTERSDVDIVLRVSADTAKQLRKLSSSDKIVRFGKANLILVENDLEYAAWLLGTRDLQRRGVSVNKRDAKRVFDQLRESIGVLDNHDSGDE